MKLATGLSVFSWRMTKRICFFARSRMSLALPMPRSFHCSSLQRKSFALIFIKHSKFSSPLAVATALRVTCTHKVALVRAIARAPSNGQTARRETRGQSNLSCRRNQSRASHCRIVANALVCSRLTIGSRPQFVPLRARSRPLDTTSSEVC